MPISHSSWETSDIKKVMDSRGEECLAEAKANGTFQETVARLQKEIDEEGGAASWERDAVKEAEDYDRQKPYFDTAYDMTGNSTS